MIDTIYLFPHDLLILKKYNRYLLLSTCVIEVMPPHGIEPHLFALQANVRTSYTKEAKIKNR